MNPKKLYPLLVLGGAVAVSMLLVLTRPRAQSEMPEPPAPLVRVVEVEKADLALVVHTQGRVEPRAEIDLVAEVSGRVVEVAPALAAGGFFAAGDLLARVDPHDYALVVDRARAEVARAEVRVATEKAEAEVALREWKSIGEGARPPALVAREPQRKEAEAALAAARATLAQATRDLERTAVVAPFAGRVRHEDVDVGEFVQKGAPLARIYSTDVAEIRLPLADEDLAFVDLPLGWRSEGDAAGGPPVIVQADFAGHRWQWMGRIVRTEGQVDPATHVVHAVAVVDDPYGRGDDPRRPPLAAGLFVEAEVQGRVAPGVVAVPRGAMRGDSRVFVVDADGRLRARKVRVLRREAERVILEGGLEGGERVCVSPLEVAVDGMKVRVAEPGAGQQGQEGKEEKAGKGSPSGPAPSQGQAGQAGQESGHGRHGRRRGHGA